MSFEKQGQKQGESDFSRSKENQASFDLPENATMMDMRYQGSTNKN